MKKIINRIGKGYVGIVLLWIFSTILIGRITWLTGIAGLVIAGYIVYRLKGGDEP